MNIVFLKVKPPKFSLYSTKIAQDFILSSLLTKFNIPAGGKEMNNKLVFLKKKTHHKNSNTPKENPPYSFKMIFYEWLLEWA